MACIALPEISPVRLLERQCRLRSDGKIEEVDSDQPMKLERGYAKKILSESAILVGEHRS